MGQMVHEGVAKVDVLRRVESIHQEIDSQREYDSILRKGHLDRLRCKKQLSNFDVSSRHDPSSSSFQRNDLDGSDEIRDVHPFQRGLLRRLEEIEDVVLACCRLSKTILRPGESD